MPRAAPYSAIPNASPPLCEITAMLPGRSAASAPPLNVTGMSSCTFMTPMPLGPATRTGPRRAAASSSRK